MKRISLLALCISLILSSCATVNYFDKPADENASLAYCAFKSIDNKVKIFTVTLRDATKGIHWPIPMYDVAENVFICTNLKPGEYYVEAIEFIVKNAPMVGTCTLYHPGILFKVAENSIVSLGTYECYAKVEKKLLQKTPTVHLFIGDNNEELDKTIMEELIEKAAGTRWENPLTSYYEQKHGGAEPNVQVY